MSFPDRSEASALKAAVAGRHGRLQDVLAGNYAGLHKRLTRQLGCPDLASESLHEAWLRLGGAVLVREPENPEGYVFRVACNAAVDLVRASRTLRSREDAEALDGIQDDAPGPERIAAARASVRALDRAYRRLPGRHQTILFALCVDESPRREVAARHGLSLRNVDTALRQAIRRCATEMEAAPEAPAGRREQSVSYW